MADWDDYDDHAGFDDGGGFGAGPAAGAAADDDWSEADSFNEPLPEADGFGDPTGAGEDAAYDKLYGMMSPSRAPSLQPSRVVGASRILRPADVDALRASLETEVMQAAHVSRDVASALLRDRKWNVESVTGLLFDGRDAAFAAAGIASWAEKEYRPSDYSPLLATAPAATAATGADPDAAAAPTATAPATSASSPEPTELCAVCYDDCARSLFLTTPCGHAFCLPCWLQYIFSELSRTRNAVRLHCLQHKCPAIVGDRLVRAAAAAAAAAQKQGLLPAELTLAAPATPEMIAAAETLVRTLAATAVPPAAAATAAASAASETAAPGSSAKKAPPAAAAAAVPAVPAAAPAPVDVAILGRWDLMLPSLGCIVRRSLVEDSRRLQWCPGRNCDLAVQPAPGATAFTCECGHEYCLQCGHDEPHAPAPCQTVQKWTALVSKEGDNAQWLMYNTKLCPHCRVRIEKNSGTRTHTRTHTRTRFTCSPLIFTSRSTCLPFCLSLSVSLCSSTQDVTTCRARHAATSSVGSVWARGRATRARPVRPLTHTAVTSSVKARRRPTRWRPTTRKRCQPSINATVRRHSL
jgi:hypothetical protein